MRERERKRGGREGEQFASGVWRACKIRERLRQESGDSRKEPVRTEGNDVHVRALDKKR